MACSAWGQAAAPVPSSETNDLLRPPPHKDKPIAVSVAIHVTNLTDIDEVTERFNLMFYLFTQWEDPRLAFKPENPMQRFHFFQPNQVWHPKLDLVNAVNARSISDSSIRVTSEGKVLYTERSSAQLSTRFHLRRFPFDRQALQIIVHPFMGQAHLVSLSGDQSYTWISTEESVYSSLAEWQLMAVETRDGPVSVSKVGPVPEARFEIVVKRRYAYYVWKIFLPLLLIVSLSWTVYWIDTRDLNSQVQISVTTILTVIAFSFSISLSLPKVPYLTFIDAFFLDCLVFVFFTAIEMTTVHVSGRTKRSNLGLGIRRISRIAVPIAFVLSNAAIALYYFG
jgi:Neurotransmitter-gated ion-channel ligand binding domain/Neurotransmitter-gated ion-channel transmembrane region